MTILLAVIVLLSGLVGGIVLGHFIGYHRGMVAGTFDKEIAHLLKKNEEELIIARSFITDVCHELKQTLEE